MMTPETVEEITIEVESEDKTVQELDKVVLTRGVWSTILFRYREYDPKLEDFGPMKATIKRYQKHQGYYKKRDSVNLTGDSAKLLIDTLGEWLKKGLLSTK
jgi:cupin superfamily acireductone dioxygenase involved in methionine salvage